MKIENDKVVTATYEMYIDGEAGKPEEMMECATEEHPLVYCHGEGMMLPSFETQMAGKQVGDSFDFRIPFEEAYGPYEEEGVMDLEKKMFFNGEGEFDSERVYVGNIIPMNTVEGQIINAQVIEISEDKVTIDLNHPLAGENLHFVGKIIDMRDVTPNELKAIQHKKNGGCCGGGCGSCGSDDSEGCNGCEGGCGNCGK